MIPKTVIIKCGGCGNNVKIRKVRGNLCECGREYSGKWYRVETVVRCCK